MNEEKKICGCITRALKYFSDMETMDEENMNIKTVSTS